MVLKGFLEDLCGLCGEIRHDKLSVFIEVYSPSLGLLCSEDSPLLVIIGLIVSLLPSLNVLLPLLLHKSIGVLNQPVFAYLFSHPR